MAALWKIEKDIWELVAQAGTIILGVRCLDVSLKVGNYTIRNVKAYDDGTIFYYLSDNNGQSRCFGSPDFELAELEELAEKLEEYVLLTNGNDKYTVYFNLSCIVPLEVIAKDEKHAIKMAQEQYNTKSLNSFSKLISKANVTVSKITAKKQPK